MQGRFWRKIFGRGKAKIYCPNVKPRLIVWPGKAESD